MQIKLPKPIGEINYEDWKKMSMKEKFDWFSKGFIWFENKNKEAEEFNNDFIKYEASKTI